MLVVVQQQEPIIQKVQMITGVPQVQLVDKVVDIPVCRNQFPPESNIRGDVHVMMQRQLTII